ncbi:hypothetical protein LCGC14_2494330, partial [marine sediment metagenome]
YNTDGWNINITKYALEENTEK